MKCELNSCQNEALYLADIGLPEPTYVCGACFAENKFWRRPHTFANPSNEKEDTYAPNRV
jgi:hypothetical protein